MDALAYFLKANLVFSALFIIYRVTLQGETWFHARRAWLLFAALLAVALPLVPIGTVSAAPFTVELPAISFQGTDEGQAPIAWAWHALRLHAFISIILLLRLMARCLVAWKSFHLPAVGAASFFNRIQVPTSATRTDRHALLAHEQVHATHGHSFDVLLYEVISALFWSNPLWRMALHELRLVHEHTADAIARRAHPDYARLLLSHALGVPSATLLNTFGSSNLKQRMTMLHNSRSPRIARRKLLLAIPALVLATALVSWKAIPTGHLASAAPDAHVFTGADQQPEFPGGNDGLIKHLTQQLKYPGSAKKERIEGTVMIGFTVQASGQVADVTVKRSVRKDLDEEAVRVVSIMPNWKPGTSKGKAVNSQLTLPIMFKLGE